MVLITSIIRRNIISATIVNLWCLQVIYKTVLYLEWFLFLIVNQYCNHKSNSFIAFKSKKQNMLDKLQQDKFEKLNYFGNQEIINLHKTPIYLP